MSNRKAFCRKAKYYLLNPKRASTPWGATPSMATQIKNRIMDVLGVVVGLAVGIIVVAYLVPVALDQFFSVDTTSWDSEVADLWPLIPLFVILGLVIAFIIRAVDF